MLRNSPLWTIADAYRRLPPARQALVYRIGLMIVVGLAVFVLLELAWQIIVSGGHCTGCSASDDPAGIGGVAGAGGAGAAGSQDDPPGKGAFDRFWDNLWDPDRPPPTVEPVTPQEKEEADRAFDLIKYGVGTKGFVEPEEGSPGDDFNKAVDRVKNIGEHLDFDSDDGDGR